ncbi:MAG: DUF2634 domain-containing protein [Clostridiales bacterium]|nr:DUF2634 domain-containing protein [Clostridiales bacterium]
MATSVYVPIAISEVVEAEELPSRTYRLDLDEGRIVGFVDELEAVKQAIRKAIITPRFKCLIYSDQYGSEVEDAIVANDATREYTEAAMEGFIKDALSPDTRILDTSDFAFEFKDDAVYISFTVDTIYGETEIQEVL